MPAIKRLQNRRLRKYIDAKHNVSEEVCTFCDKTFNSEKQLQGHLNQCLEYGNTTIKGGGVFRPLI